MQNKIDLRNFREGNPLGNFNTPSFYNHKNFIDEEELILNCVNEGGFENIQSQNNIDHISLAQSNLDDSEFQDLMFMTCTNVLFRQKNKTYRMGRAQDDMEPMI